MLDGFRDKDFLEQIILLNQLSADHHVENLPALVALVKEPTGDISLDSMIANTLNAIYTAHPEEAVKGISSKSAALRILSIRACGETLLPEALPALMARCRKTESTDERHDILNALARFNAPESLPVFRECLTDEDDLVAALCIEICGRMKDESSIPVFLDILRNSEKGDKYDDCSLQTWKAINSLSVIGTDEALQGLTELLHHKNPTARRIITDAMVVQGEQAVPFLVNSFQSGDIDQRILVSNLLGFIGSKAGADGLVNAIDRGLADDENVRYALYEALGRIGTIKGIICLMDGLNEENELTLMAVVGGLERQVNPGLVQQLAARLLEGDEQSSKLARVIIASQATRLFSNLYSDQRVGDLLIDALATSKDAKILAAFDEVLSSFTQAPNRVKEDLERLPGLQNAARTALVADDSKSMLAMQRSILTDLGYAPTLVTDGAQALDLAEEEDFDLVLTDMNMPVMDGMELIQELRAMEEYEDVPIIMITTESEAAQRNMAEQSGVTAFITKPFKPEALKAIISNLPEK